MTKEPLTKELNNYVVSKLVAMPDFLSYENTLEVKIWEVIIDITQEIGFLVSLDFKSEKEILRIISNIQEHNYVLIDLTSGHNFHLLDSSVKHIVDMINELKELSIQYECYETTRNIERFNYLYKNYDAFK